MIEGVSQAPIPFILGILFLVGLAADVLGRFTFLPRVTLLLIGGLALGPTGFEFLPTDLLQNWFPAMTSIALALIGFLLGQQLSIAHLKNSGKRIIGISVCKVVGAWLAVGFALLAMGVNPIAALLLAGIAPATAPTATYDVVHECGAKGEFADTLLSIVAIDDVWGLLLFTVMMAFVGVHNGDVVVSSAIATGFIEVGGSFALGLVLGVPMAYLTGRIRQGEPMLAEGMGFVLLGAGAAEWLSLSPILTSMTMGGAVASLAKHHERPFHAIEGVEWPFMILFFVLAGASLEIGEARMVGGVAFVYMLSRGVGIYIGTRSGSRLTGASPQLRKWLGAALLPQAGVAIGMALLASQRFPEIASIVLPVVLSSTIVLELFAPIVTRQALRAAGTLDASANQN